MKLLMLPDINISSKKAMMACQEVLLRKYIILLSFFSKHQYTQYIVLHILTGITQ